VNSPGIKRQKGGCIKEAGSERKEVVEEEDR